MLKRYLMILAHLYKLAREAVSKNICGRILLTAWFLTTGGRREMAGWVASLTRVCSTTSELVAGSPATREGEWVTTQCSCLDPE